MKGRAGMSRYDAGGHLFMRLRDSCPADWSAYCRHGFVVGLQSGDLPASCFRHYLIQDYLFLIHFSRAWALAAFKSDNLSDMRSAAATLNALLESEMEMHVEFAAGWGVAREEMEGAIEAPANMAYTRFVLERGVSGDLLDLLVALAPCVIGYAEIGCDLRSSEATRRDGNPYLPWIQMYAGADYQQVATDMGAQLDRLARTRMTEQRFPELARTFRQATRLEIGFWEMGLGGVD